MNDPWLALYPRLTAPRIEEQLHRLYLQISFMNPLFRPNISTLTFVCIVTIASFRHQYEHDGNGYEL